MDRTVRKNESENYSNPYILCGLIAAELFMSFSFLGYVHIAPISITFVYIPVLITGCLLGPKESALVGAVFGLSSMWKASAFYVGAGDAIFSPSMSGRPLESILLSVGSRVLFGLVIGILYYLAKRSRHPLAGIILVTTVGRTVHTFFVYAFMGLFFPESGFGIENVINDIRRWDFPLFILIVDSIVCLCWYLYRTDHVRNFLGRIRKMDSVDSLARHYRMTLVILLVFFLCSSISVALYFTDRIGSVMTEYGLDLEEKAVYDLMHLEIQFLFGIISLALLAMIIIILYLKNVNYLYYKARLDSLTGLMGRQQFFQEGERLLGSMRYSGDGKSGWFIIMDIDSFKEINDQYGHPEGDRALEKVAEALRQTLGKKAILGRLGGDEFVAFVYFPLTRKEIDRCLNSLKLEVAKIRIEKQNVTCSIGAISVKEGYTGEDLYRSADRLLYEAKKKGKDQFVYGEYIQDRTAQRDAADQDGTI